MLQLFTALILCFCISFVNWNWHVNCVGCGKIGCRPCVSKWMWIFKTRVLNNFKQFFSFDLRSKKIYKSSTFVNSLLSNCMQKLNFFPEWTGRDYKVREKKYIRLSSSHRESHISFSILAKSSIGSFMDIPLKKSHWKFRWICDILMETCEFCRSSTIFFRNLQKIGQ